MKHLQLFFIYVLIALASINSAHAEEDLTGMDRVYLVITTSDMTEAFTTLTNYRETEKGGSYTTHIETMAFIEANFEGVDRAEKVRNYIKDSYRNHGTRFVVLGGDADGEMENHKVPMRGLYQKYEVEGEVIAEDTSVPSDRYYAYLDGSFNSDGDEYWGEVNDGADLFPENKNLDWGYEVAVGRVAADNTEEALNHINKIIAFEAQDLPGTSILAGQKINEEPTWGGDNLDYLRVCADSTKLYDRDRTSPWTSNDIIELINSNQFSMLHHSGYSDIGTDLRLNMSDIARLHNDPIFIYSQGGYAAAIDSDNSFAEMITNKYSDGGAAAFIGSSRQAWLEPNDSASAWMHQMFQEFQCYSDYHIGVALLVADLELRHGGYSTPRRWASMSTVLIGDPAIQIYNQNSNNSPEITGFEGTIRTENDFNHGINIQANALDTDYGLHTITIFLDGNTLTSKSIDRGQSDTLSYYLQFAELEPGEHCISARADDVFGNFSPMSEKVCFTIEDTNAPIVNDVKINMHPDIQEIIVWVYDADQNVEQVECAFDNTYTTSATLILDDTDTTHWECQIPDLLLDREHQVTVQAKDKAGLLSNVSGPHMFQFQRMPFISFAHGNTMFEEVEPEIYAHIFSIEAYAEDPNGDLESVEVLLNETSYTTLPVTGDFSSFVIDFPIHQFERGEYCVSLMATDLAGNVSIPSNDICFSVQQIPPQIEDTKITISTTEKNVTSTVSDPEGGIRFVECLFNNSITIEARQIDGGFTSGTWKCSIPSNLEGNKHTVSIRSQDITDKSSETDVFNFELNRSPRLTVNVINIRTPEVAVISGYASDKDGDLERIEMRFDSSNYWVTANGTENYSFDAHLKPGKHTVTVKAVDENGNTTSMDRDFTVTATDTCTQYTATNVEHVSAGRAYTKTEMSGGYCWGTFCWGQNETTTWHAVGSDNNLGTSADSEITLSEKPAGHFSVNACPANSYTPVATIDSWDVQEGNLTITGTATDPNSDLKGITLHGDNINKSCTLEGSIFNCTVNGLADGDYVFYVTAYDAIGNTGIPSNSIDFTVGAIDNCVTATNYQHTQDGRASAGGMMNLYTYAVGSGDSLGLKGSNSYSTTTSLKETSTSYWAKVDNCN